MQVVASKGFTAVARPLQYETVGVVEDAVVANVTGIFSVRIFFKVIT